MAEDNDSDTCPHFKRRINKIEGKQDSNVEQETENPLSTEHKLYEIASVTKEDTEIAEISSPFVSDYANNFSKKVKWSPEFDCKVNKVFHEYVNEAIAGTAQRSLEFEEVLQTVSEGIGGVAEKKMTVEKELGVSAVQELSGDHTVTEGNKSVLDVQMDSVVQECIQGLDSCASSVAGENQGLMAKEIEERQLFEMGLDSFLKDSFLKGKKKEFSKTLMKTEENRFLKGPDVVRFADFDRTLGEYDGGKVDGFKGRDGSVRCSLKIEVIDDTALIDSIPLTKSGNGYGKEKGVVGCAQNAEQNGAKNGKQEVDGKKEKRSRRGKRGGKGKGTKKGPEMNGMPIFLTNTFEAANGCEKTRDGSKKLYSRKEMEALRFVNVEEQKKKWCEVYCGLGPAVAREYDGLLNSVNQKHFLVDFDPRHLLGKKEEAPPLFHEGMCSQDVDREIEIMRENEMENVNPVDLGCGHRARIEDGYTAPDEECSEDSDSDGYYDNIHRPAFYVEGEPNFDSGPPEDGLEYLRRVRWEASKIPKVKVVKLDRSKVNKDQTVYMPSIPEIAKCPEHLVPSKEWEDTFLADFVELRLALSRQEDSDPKSNVSESSGDCPTVSAILGMDSVTRVSMLRKRITSVETMSVFLRSNCVWLFSLCAAVDTPLDADTSAALRCLLRKCASLRAEKSELDDEVIMLNILATISGRYFGQAEN